MEAPDSPLLELPEIRASSALDFMPAAAAANDESVLRDFA